MPEVIVDRPELVVDAVARLRIDHRQEFVRFTALEEIQVPVVADILRHVEGGLVRVRAVRRGLERHATGHGEVPLLVDFGRERFIRPPHGWTGAIVHRH